jgi:ribose transport system substrate-binding protein
MRKVLKVSVLCVMIVFLIITFCLIGFTEATAPLTAVPVITKADKPWNIGFVFKGLGNEWAQKMLADTESHAADIGIMMKADGMEDIEFQTNLIETYITLKMDAIVIAPTDAKGLVPPVVKAMKAGIVVINVDSMLDQALLKDAGVAVPYIGPDNRAASKLSGDELGKVLSAGDKVVILEGEPGAENGQQRTLGFKDSVQEYNLNLVASETAHWQVDPAFTLMGDLLTTYPDIKGVMADNDNMALGALQAIDAAGKTGKILVVGFDNDSAAQQSIKEGKMLATIEQYGGQVASWGLDAAVATLQGATFANLVPTKVELITKEDLQ